MGQVVDSRLTTDARFKMHVKEADEETLLGSVRAA